MPRSGIAGSYGGFIPSFFKESPYCLHSGCLNLYFHQQCKSILFSTPSLAFLVCRLFDDGRYDWRDVISHRSFDLHFSNNEQCLNIFSCVCYPSVCLLWRNVCLSLFSHFLIGLFVFLVLSCMSCFYVLEINPLSVFSFAIIFSHSEGCVFTMLRVSFAVQKLLSLISSNLLTFVLYFPLKEVGHRGSCFDLCHQVFCLCFPLRVL